MIDQPLLDEIADELVADGELVSYTSVQRALKKKKGRGASYRDIQDPLADWKAKRRYKGHLAVLDLPEEMEKAIAGFATSAIKIAEARALAALPVTSGQGPAANLLEQMQRIVTGLERQLATLADENRQLRNDITALAPRQTVALIEDVAPNVQKRIRKGRGRRTGIPARMATIFWNEVMSSVSDIIYAGGRPVTADELLPLIPGDILEMAAEGFEELDATRLGEKLAQRILGRKFGLFHVGEDHFAVFPMSPEIPELAEAAAAAA
ncbi:DNA-binding protein [Methylobacterium sp. E-046]|uniref:DNA-binding protein n=1 Tax=Methylobacterium sp. E-046 TaxID=2836576 RepID=UPI001FBB28BD|nr:DNA-binding protein [Methylobacterium sp. E-046]MCJ2099211.1 DNA-binding protein [Methylobacterium sp. E-046]